MSCQIKKNTFGEVESIIGDSPVYQKLVKDIVSIPVVSDLNTVADIYTNVKASGKAIEDYKGIVYTSKGKEFTNYLDLLSENEGSNYSINLKLGEELIEIVNNNLSTSKNSTESRINNLLIKGYLTGESRILDGKIVFEPAGISLIEKSNSIVESIDILGKHRVSKTDSGELLFNEYEESNDPMLKSVLEKVKNNLPKAEVSKKIDISNIESSFLHFLNSLGIDLTTLENYKQNYGFKNPKSNYVKALADISNGVIAIESGQESEFYEELAHIAIEYYSNQESIEEALLEVASTKEYEEFSEIYRELYSENLSNQELETKVRREVLGKILAKQLKETPKLRSNTGNILNKIWNFFTSRILSSIKPYHKGTISKLTSDLETAIIQNNTGMFTNSGKKGVFYSVSPESSLNHEVDNVVRHFEGIFRNGKTLLSTVSFKQARKIDEQADNLRILKLMDSVLSSVESINLETKSLKSTVEPSILKGHVDRVLASEPSVLSLLNQYEAGLDIKQDNLHEKFVNKITSNFTKARAIQKNLESLEVEIAKKSAIETSKEIGVSEEETENALKSIFTDSSLVFKWLGRVSDSVNPILAQIPKIISDMKSEAVQKVQKTIPSFLNEAKSKGWDKMQTNLYSKDKDGKTNGYLISPWDYSKQKEIREEEYVNILVDISGKDIDTVKKAFENKTIQGSLGLDSEQMLEYATKVNLINRNTRLNVRDSSYYNELDSKYEKLGISNITREFQAEQSAERYSILQKVQKEGKEDRSLLSTTDLLRLDKLGVRKKLKTNPFDSEGNLKEGLIIKKIQDFTYEEIQKSQFKDLLEGTPNKGMEIVVQDPNYIDSLPEDSKIALDLNNLNYDFIQTTLNEGSTDLSSDFFMELEKQEGVSNIEAFNWIKSNGGFKLSEDFIDIISNTVGYEEDVKTYIDSLTDPVLKVELEQKLKTFSRLKSEKNNLLKPYKTSDQLGTVNLDIIPEETKTRLKELDSEVLLSQNSIGLPVEFKSESTLSTEVFLNKSLELKFKNSPEDLINYLVSNMTEDNKSLVLQFKRELKRYIEAKTQGKEAYLKKSFIDFIEDNSQITANTVSKDTALNFIVRQYAISKAPSYMKTFRPEGSQNLIKNLENGRIKITDFIKDREGSIKEYPVLKYFDINPGYSWREESNFRSTLNEEYKEDSTFDTPKYINKDFFKRYFNNPDVAINKWKSLTKDDISLLQPTKNKEEYEFLLKAITLNKAGHTANDVVETTSKYQIPQFPKSQFERTDAILRQKGKWSTFRTAVGDVFQSREDELLEGEIIEELIDQDSANVIPKYGVKRLKDQADLSENLLTNLSTYYARAEEHSARVKYSTELEGRLAILKNSQFKTRMAGRGNSKTLRKGIDSNSYKMAKRKIEEQVYGVKESYSVKTKVLGQELDVTATMNSLHKFVTKRNLAYGVIADATSLTSGVVNNFIESRVGEFWSKKSASKGNAILTRMMADYLRETGRIDKKSDFSKLGELFGTFDIEDRLDNSKYNRWLRMVLPSKSAFGLSEAANVPVVGKVIMNAVMDLKYIDGKFIDSNQFYNIKKKDSNNSKSKKEIDIEFNSPDNKSLYDFLDFSGESINFNSDFEAIFKEDSKNQFETAVKKATSKIKVVNEAVDGMISDVNNVEAKANFISNFFMTHRSWFLIAMGRRWKGRSMDFMVGRETEGSYNNLFRTVLPTIARNMRDIGTVEGFKKAWQEVSDDDISVTSMKRIMVDTMMLAALLAIGELVMASDDPDDSWLEDFYQLIYLRTTSEVNSTNLLGVRHNLYEILESPIVALKVAKELDPIGITEDAVDLDGKKLLKRFNNNIILRKRYLDLIDLKDNKAQHIKYNGQHLYNLAK